MKKKLIILGLIAIILGGAGYYAKYYAPTAGWKTYTNAEYGYQFKYPADWKIIEEGKNGGVHLSTSLVDSGSNFEFWVIPPFVHKFSNSWEDFKNDLLTKDTDIIRGKGTEILENFSYQQGEEYIFHVDYYSLDLFRRGLNLAFSRQDNFTDQSVIMSRTGDEFRTNTKALNEMREVVKSFILTK